MRGLKSGLESADRAQGASALFGHKSVSRIFEVTASEILCEVQALKLVTSRHPLSHMALVLHLA